MQSNSPARTFLARLDSVERRLAAYVASPPSGLTEPEPSSGERWDASQIWAHLAEFVPYWLQQARIVVEQGRKEPVAFGRVKTDPRRIAAIEQHRHDPVSDLAARLNSALAELRAFLLELPSDAWSARGYHSARGVMDLTRIVDEFIVGHLEEHADQLDQLARASTEG